jgi:Tfp pilus assembly major pilin PilA
VLQSTLTQSGGVVALASTTITGFASTTGALQVGGAISGSSTLAIQSSADFRGAITQAGGTVSLASTTVTGNTTTTSLTIGAIGGVTNTSISGFSCATATWDPPALTTSGVPLTSAVSLALTLPGAAVGDVCFASHTTATTTVPVSITCRIDAASSSVITVANNSSSSYDIISGTAKACFLR